MGAPLPNPYAVHVAPRPEKPFPSFPVPVIPEVIEDKIKKDPLAERTRILKEIAIARAGVIEYEKKAKIRCAELLNMHAKLEAKE